jgi:outer membrane immunogenic protein
MPKHFRALSVLLATAVAGAGTASAADLPDLAPPAIAPAPLNSVDIGIAGGEWTGLYLGAHLGGVTSNDFSQASSAVSGGIQAGYLQQFDSLVVGAEIASSLHDELRYQLTPVAGLAQHWSVTATGRAGMAFGQTLVYGLAGLSLAQLDPSAATSSASTTHAGAVFGAGIEQALGDGWSIRAEYQQTRYWNVTSTAGGIDRRDDLVNHAVTAGINYRF